MRHQLPEPFVIRMKLRVVSLAEVRCESLNASEYVHKSRRQRDLFAIDNPIESANIGYKFISTLFP